MKFESILFKGYDTIKDKVIKNETPVFFGDLNIDQIINTIVSGKEEYNLKPFFYSPLTDPETIYYRNEIMQDMEDSFLFETLKLFATNMQRIRDQSIQLDKLSNSFQKERLFLDIVNIYCESISTLSTNLSQVGFKSHGFTDFFEYVKNYITSSQFVSLFTKTRKITEDLSSIKYSYIIKALNIQVLKFKSELDYTAEVESTFWKFKQGEVKNYLYIFQKTQELNNVEIKILEGVAQLHPDIFFSTATFFEENTNYIDEKIRLFDREIQFYISFHEYILPLKNAGLKFCYPRVSDVNKEVYNYEGFDLALAHNLINNNLPIVVNDFYLKGDERIIVVSGPNQGGKTTFARTFGQLHYLASIGCPVPGRKAQLFLYDKIFVHFEKEEKIQNLHGKLEDDLFRIHDIISNATPKSIIILNEILTSTTLHDAIFLSQKILDKIIQLNVLCVWVTFIDELASVSKATVSMVSTVEPENPAMRTFKIIRRQANGLAYALSIAEKYKLTYKLLMERIKS